MKDAYICDYQRTSIGKYGGSLSTVRPDDLLAHTIQEITRRNPHIDWDCVDDVIAGCANQAGEDNRCVARMAALLAGLPLGVSGTTINRLCASGMDAVAFAASCIKADDGDLYVAGGVESMSRAPFVMPKADIRLSRTAEIFDTTIGWRFINKKMKDQFGVDSMPQTGEHVAKEFSISRERQDAFALASQQKYQSAKKILSEEIVPVVVPVHKKDPITVAEDEHPRAGSSLDTLAKLKPIFPNGTVTAGNASGVNDGSAMLLIAGEESVKRFSLKPLAKVVAVTRTGVEPRIMGIGPRDATQKLLQKTSLSIDDIDYIELNEAFASQALATLESLGIADDDSRVNIYGGAIALGHPLGMSGARLLGTLATTLARNSKRYGIATMCVGVGQGVSVLIENAT